jgi:hypothetical protein
MSLYVGGCKVKIVTGRRSQTVNVYVDNSRDGVYDPKVRIEDPARFVTEEMLQGRGLASIEDLVAFLLMERGGVNEGTWLGRVGAPPSAAGPFDLGDPEWTDRAIPEVERAINALLDEFLRSPNLHRVEHSLHCALYQHLAASKLLSPLVDHGAFTTGIVHKEWPETIPRPGKGNRRGNFDLVVLAPPRSGAQPASVIDFYRGLIQPAIVIEVGLDYGLHHLKEDLKKLSNSHVEHGYLVHLARWIGAPQDDVADCVLDVVRGERSDGPRIAYAYVGLDEVRYRRLGDAFITTRRAEVVPVQR